MPRSKGPAQPPAETGPAAARHLPEATLVRLTQYLRALTELRDAGRSRASSEVLAEAAGVNSAILRKDLSLLGSYGTRGVGYETEVLAQRITECLGLTHEWRVSIIGAGNLGRALSGYGGFRNRGFSVVALFDASPDLIGRDVNGLRVANVAFMEDVLTFTRTNMAVLAVPGPVAQELADRVVRIGVRSILSFAPVVLQVPEGVTLRKVDLATELQILAYHAQQAGQTGPPERS